ncbi:hypothetical protein [Bradyrhizobium acaciae]|uniref:hypothetical protein n=1 Tax=Bradyrhizobium acaciae TaxID=2683706 RepID=UPI001E4582D4|nr:hypothetical protein [Bradyrhizobium acaciae]MCC8979716.1 hypothetical protein [Bradyrhizobium acaciae]
MTLVVAGVVEGIGFIVSDTLITGGTIQLREREFQIKCLPAQDRRSLAAFSGDAHGGGRLIAEAAAMPSGLNTVSMLAKAQVANPGVDFVYIYLDETAVPHLYKISSGKALEVPAAYIGDKGAFEQFQNIRHAPEDPIPKSIEAFAFAGSSPSEPPSVVSTSTLSMLRLFLRRAERDVGGWAVTYTLGPGSVYMCQYMHSVSDPILDKVSPGTVVPHGTAEAGGYGLSVTEIGNLEGLAIYYRQIPGGLILIREAQGYKLQEFDGIPAEFRAKASDVVGKPVEVWFSDVPLGALESLTILRDEHGKPAGAMAKSGGDFAFTVLNVETPFSANAVFDLKDKK